MKMTLKRIFKGNQYTIGKLYIDGEYFCDTLEDAVRPEKIKNETAIPAGTYDVILNMSNRFKKILPLLLKVPNYEGVRIHSGNTKEDTSGCILVGENKVKGQVINSKQKMNELMKLLIKESYISITIS